MEKRSFLGRWIKGLERSRENLTGRLASLFSRHPTLDEELWEGIEEILIQADVGLSATTRLVELARETAARERFEDSAQVVGVLKDEIAATLGVGPEPMLASGRDHIVLGIGVNGTGKTTTLAKLAAREHQAGRGVLLAAADTFRAAAIEQLDEWGRRIGVDVIKHERGADAAAVVYDAAKARARRSVSTLLVDTAGRLHTYANLMEELKKIRRVAERDAEGAVVVSLLVVDATTGQNALSQVKLFDEGVGVDGIALTKLDGTAKGGIVIAIREEFDIPIAFAGVGEGIEDLADFDAARFAEGLLG